MFAVGQFGEGDRAPRVFQGIGHATNVFVLDECVFGAVKSPDGNLFKCCDLRGITATREGHNR